MNLLTLFPAYAGVIPDAELTVTKLTTFPRTRGGDPGNVWEWLLGLRFSPHTRG